MQGRLIYVSRRPDKGQIIKLRDQIEGPAIVTDQPSGPRIDVVPSGRVSVQVDGRWTEAVKGAFLLIPGGVIHTFENRTTSLAGILSFNNDAGFEEQMPSISQWFAKNPPEDAI